jgi:hypothetical protein
MKLTAESRQTCPSATLSATNPTWTDPGSNPGLCGERPATNRVLVLLLGSVRVGFVVYKLALSYVSVGDVQFFYHNFIQCP